MFQTLREFSNRRPKRWRVFAIAQMLFRLRDSPWHIA